MGKPKAKTRSLGGRPPPALAPATPQTPPPVVLPSLTQLGTSTSKKRIWGVTNPLDFTPCEYHMGLFKCNYPLISISYVMPADDKFEGLHLKEQTRRQAVNFLLQPSFEAFQLHNFKSELGGRWLHSALFHNLYKLTKPSQGHIKRLGNMHRQFERLKRRRVQPSPEDLVAQGPTAEPGDNLDLHVEVTEGAVPLLLSAQSSPESIKSAGSNKSLNVEEETAPDTEATTGKGRVDIKIFVHNNRNITLKDLFGGTHDVKSLKAACICECTWDKEEDEDKIFQGAGYACQQALSNLANLHFDSLYVLALSRSDWTYGILDYRGTVDVVNGQIDSKSMQRFSLQESIRFADNPLSPSMIQNQFEQATTYFRQHYTSLPEAVYPNGTYLVGTLHLCDTWFRLPDYSRFAGGDEDDVDRFYEGLMRIVIGNKVNDWEVKDFEDAKGLRESLTQAQFRCFCVDK